MEVSEMKALVERHLKAEGAGDIEGAVSVYTDDIHHDPVGFPGAPYQGKDAARAFYGHLTQNFLTEEETPTHEYATKNALVMEQLMTVTELEHVQDAERDPAVVAGEPEHLADHRAGHQWTSPR